MTEQILTLKELAAKFRVSAITIRRMVINHQIPHFRIGRQIRFDLNEVNKWLKERD